MRHIRKVLAFGLAVVFLIALVIGAGVIFSVRNVNVTYEDYSSLYGGEYEQCKEELLKIKGSSLLFLKEEDVKSKVGKDELIVVKSYEKVYPCTVNIVLKERVETFAVLTTEGYSVYDADGAFIKATNSFTLPLNKIDGCPVVTINADGDKLKDIANLCAIFGQKFGSVRRLLESVSLESFLGVLEFKFRSGLSISVSDWQNAGEQKMQKAYEKYSSLDDKQKSGGVITVISGKDNPTIFVDYKAI